jgi:putative N6-adenine-specific DNA methylase
MDMETPSGSFAKRVRRRVSSRDYTFLAVVQPALEYLCGQELEENGFSLLGGVDGGVEFFGPLREGWRANLLLRTASRVYCRVARFRCGAREELFRRIAAFAWELWLPAGADIRLEVKVRASRLRHEGAAAEAFFDGLLRRRAEAGLASPGWTSRGRVEDQRILLRVTENTAEISLDMSGLPLYTRGYRTGGGRAPLRETLAAALLRELGWRGEGLLVDGMTGCGTFAVEAALIAAGMPPGGRRDFRFQAWPSFAPAGWAYIKKQAASGAACGKKDFFLYASDILDQAVLLARKNAARAGTEELIRWETRDFFDLTGAGLKDLRAKVEGPSYLVLNPPYGKRLAEGGEALYRNLGRHIRRGFPGWNILVLFPGAAALAAFGGRPRRALRLRHGGMAVSCGIFVP